ncbi:PRTRC system ThiF family protein [Mucilaginibacter paludis]|uniref:PRTRC system ThiF family protein n=1 Tax=Mucilaginibacter paludis DSM 18603 TaxID=714943 RepID=H1Y617_9SPHI|nr:PRTRC system ThiF family protein [Mucilaginibacter paludis]EHQ30976.1 PRTRC system ThiF family protein [Mucilaginibacter paludis DSM 18603]
MRTKKLQAVKPAAHIVEKTLLNPYNPIIVNLIGAGGTGSQFLTALARMNHALIALNHPGLMVRVFDDDRVEEANLGRQLFSMAELGLHKAVALVNRINLFFGTNWKAIPERYDANMLKEEPELAMAELTISCVDTASARFEIADLLSIIYNSKRHTYHHPLYWMDFGNSKETGQVILSTIADIQQPASKKFAVVSRLPLVTEEFKELLESSEKADNTPSCSLAEALTRQDLFINSALANLGASLLWQMFREGMLFNRGFFLNLKDFRAQPIMVTPAECNEVKLPKPKNSKRQTKKVA